MAIAEHSIAPELIQSYVDRELTGDEAAAVEAHIAVCEECRSLARSLEAMSVALRQWHVEASPKTLHAPVTRRNRSMSRILVPLASVAALLVFAVTALLLRPSRESAPRYDLAKELGEVEGIPEVPAAATGHGMRQPGWGGFYDKSAATAATASDVPPPMLTPPAGTSTVTARPTAQRQEVRGQQGQQGQQSRMQLGQGQQGRAVSRASMVVRTVMLSLVTRNFDDVRPSLDRILTQAGGFVGNLETSAARGDARWLRGTVRVPSAQLPATIDAIKKLGSVRSESQGGEDVADQATDLDARLANARETERRLVQVLQQRTGKVGDVLEVEREVARVREEIERMSAERANLADRVSYATISLDIREEQKASLNIDPPSAGGRLRNALVEGVTMAIESALGTIAFLVRIAPLVLMWGVILAGPMLIARKRLRALVDRA